MTFSFSIFLYCSVYFGFIPGCYIVSFSSRALSINFVISLRERKSFAEEIK